MIQDIHDLFENENGAAVFQETVQDATHMVLSEEKLKKLFKALSSSTQNVAYTYGLDDLVFNNRAAETIRTEGLEQLIGK